MSMKFTSIPVLLKYPPAHRAKLSSLHSSVITYVSENYSGTYRQRRIIIQVLNTLSYLIIEGEAIPKSWDEANPLVGLELVDDDVCKSKLGETFIVEKNITWDVEVSENATSSTADVTDVPKTRPTPQSIKAQETAERHAARAAKSAQPQRVSSTSLVSIPTSKEDLYIRPPVVPQFDYKQVFASGVVDEKPLVVYYSRPDIPTKQNEISCTTDVNKMTSQNLRALFPNRFIQTRSNSMYTPVPGLEFHPQLGVIIPVDGFSNQELIDNLIRYPHIFQLKKTEPGGEVISFYKTVEIDGELKDIIDVWDTLPDTQKMPKTADFIKEYTVRRYLLERDIRGLHHEVQMYGTLEPFLTLFTTIDNYIQFGFSDIEELARSCVRARVSYKQSRNPVLRRLTAHA